MSSQNGLLLPEGSRLVHIGPHKTGSSAVQVALHKARDDLARHGVHYAGAGTRPREAGWSIGITGRPAGSQPPSIDHWHALVAEVAGAGDRRVCISNEDFGRAGPSQRERIVRELGDGRVHVVAVARRLDRYLPSQWQERVKAGHTRSYDDWLRVVLDRSTSDFDWERANVWRAHDVKAMVGHWVELVGEHRFTLIVSDETDRLRLPHTFEGLLGLPAGTLALRPKRSNRSLSWGETEMIRAVHQVFDQRGWPPDVRRAFLENGLIRKLRSRPAEATGPRTPPLPGWAAKEVRALSDRRADAIAAMGVRVVGDPDAMRVPDDVPVGDSDPEPLGLTPSGVADVVEAVLEIALKRERRLEKRASAAAAAAAAAQDAHVTALGRVAEIGRRVARRIQNSGGA